MGIKLKLGVSWKNRQSAMNYEFPEIILWTYEHALLPSLLVNQIFSDAHLFVVFQENP